MPYCPKCGKEVSSEVRYCPQCGANLEGYKERAKDLLQEKIQPSTTVHSNFLLHEKIAEARHNEIIGYIVSGFGVFLAFTALFVANIRRTRTEWHWIIPVEVEYSPLADVAWLLFTFGFIIIAIGAIISFYYYYQRSELMKGEK